MQIFCWYLRGTLLLLWNEESAFMVISPHNHYQIVYLYYSVFQIVSTYCFSIFGSRLGANRIFDTVFKINIISFITTI